MQYIKIKEWEEKFDREKKLKEQEEIRREQKLRQKELEKIRKFEELENQTNNPVELDVAGTFVLCERHKHTINEVILCLESETPFCFLQSEVASYLEYYKEVIIDCLKSKEEVGLLFFDPKFGDDLSVILGWLVLLAEQLEGLLLQRQRQKK